MNQDAQIFNDNQECLNDLYLERNMSENLKKDEQENDIPTTQPNQLPPQPTDEEEKKTEKTKKEVLNWADTRFSMSSFQLYETKTASKLCFFFSA